MRLHCTQILTSCRIKSFLNKLLYIAYPIRPDKSRAVFSSIRHNIGAYHLYFVWGNTSYSYWTYKLVPLYCTHGASFVQIAPIAVFTIRGYFCISIVKICIIEIIKHHPSIFFNLPISNGYWSHKSYQYAVTLTAFSCVSNVM